MPDDGDPGSDKPWQGRRPGWDFDGWGTARGGRQRWTWVPMRASGADRIVGIASWSAFGVLVLASLFTDNMWLGMGAILVAAAGAISRKAIRHFRKLRNPEEG